MKEQSTKDLKKLLNILFSLLKIGIVNQSYELLIEAYGERWVLEPLGYYEISVKELFDELDHLRYKWHQRSKKYVGKVRAWAIESFILSQMDKFEDYFIYYLTQWLMQWDETESFMSLNKSKRLGIYFGDYKNKMAPVFIYEQSEGIKDVVINQIPPEKMVTFSQWRDINMQEIEIKNKDLSCATYKRSLLKDITFTKCTMTLSNFKNIKISHCQFDFCDLKLSDFSYGSLEEVVFKECQLDKIDFSKTHCRNVKIIDRGSVFQLNERGEEEIL